MDWLNCVVLAFSWRSFGVLLAIAFYNELDCINCASQQEG
jgi:hypothetical protein